MRLKPHRAKQPLRWLAGLLAAVFFLQSCEKSQLGSPLFKEASSNHTGVTFSNMLTEDEEFNLIEYLYFYNGGGVAIGDINNDGLTDIYLSANQQDNKLYLNKGGWEFEDITEKAGVAAAGPWKTGVVMADVNGDGFLDIYQCRVSSYKGTQGANQLFINNGDLTFSEKASVYGLDFKGFSTQAAFFDYDLDGDLDMYLLNHSVHTERSYGKATLRNYDDGLAGDRLFRNDNSKFVSVTKEAGIYSSHIGYGLGVGISDVNNDGWPDIYVSNDFNENDYLYLNNGPNSEGLVTFTESIEKMIGHTSRFSMGSDLADYNNDGLIDIVSLDMLPDDEEVIKRSAGDDSYEIYSLKLKFGYARQFARNSLQLNTGVAGNGMTGFAEIGQLAGIHATDWSWAALFADYDNDGHKDLFISNGIKRRPNDMDYINFLSDRGIPDGLANNPDLSDKRLVDEMPDGAVHNYLFKNNGDLTFSDASERWGMDTPTLSNGAAYGDLDNDGDLDLVVNNINRKASLYRNNTYESGGVPGPSYLKVMTVGKGKNPYGIGARVIAYARGKMFVQENYTVRGFQSSVSPLLQFGLGDVQTLDSLRVIWPGGKTQLLKDIKVNRTLQVEEAVATAFHPFAQPFKPALLLDISDSLLLDFAHIENNFNDFNREFLIPHVISREGPALAVADVNGDSLDDFYIGNAAGSAGALFLQSVDSPRFRKSPMPLPAKSSQMEETAALFFDANGDGFPDLYIVAAGNELAPPHKALNDRLLINDGSGSFTDRSDWLPTTYQHGAVAVAADFDQDGDEDLFVGGRVVPGQYGINPRSYLLTNDGSGRFTDATASLAPALSEVGMVTDAAWTDLDGNGYPDLVVVGEWMPITIFSNNSGRLTQATAPGLAGTEGWWKTLAVADIDNDGDNDFIVGNLGENTRHKPTTEYPVLLYLSDFDTNGSLDGILAYSTPEGVFTVSTKDELIRQIPSLKKEFVKHRDFAGKTVEEVFGEEALAQSIQLKANTFQSVYIENQGAAGFRVTPLPLQAQFAPIAALCVFDFNGDGNADILAGGNDFGASPYFGTYDAGRGLVLLGNGKGQFTPVGPGRSGLNVGGAIKEIKIVASGKKLLIVIARNNDKPLIYTVNDSLSNIF